MLAWFFACLAGAFAGAYTGADAWPTEWADRIEYRGDLMALGALWDSWEPMTQE